MIANLIRITFCREFEDHSNRDDIALSNCQSNKTNKEAIARQFSVMNDGTWTEEIDDLGAPSIIIKILYLCHHDAVNISLNNFPVGL